MKTTWTRFAVESLRDIYDYYFYSVSPAIADKIRKGIVDEAKKIHKHPASGQKQDLLSPLQQEHRYFLKGHYKIVYRIINDEVIITDIFDTRQHPSKINDENR